MRVESLATVKHAFSHFVTVVKKEPIIITRNGRIAAVLEHLTDDGVEDYLLERSPKFRAMLDKAARRGGGMSLGEYRESRGV